MQAVAAFPSSLNYAAPKAALVHAAAFSRSNGTASASIVVAPGATIAGMAAASVQSGKYDRHIASGAISRFGRPKTSRAPCDFFSSRIITSRARRSSSTAVSRCGATG